MGDSLFSDAGPKCPGNVRNCSGIVFAMFLLWFCYVFAMFCYVFAMSCYVLLCFFYVVLRFAMLLVCFAMFWEISGTHPPPRPVKAYMLGERGEFQESECLEREVLQARVKSLGTEHLNGLSALSMGKKKIDQ